MVYRLRGSDVRIAKVSCRFFQQPPSLHSMAVVLMSKSGKHSISQYVRTVVSTNTGALADEDKCQNGFLGFCHSQARSSSFLPCRGSRTHDFYFLGCLRQKLRL